MCLFTLQTESCIADKSIECWKVVNKLDEQRFNAIFYEKLYNIGELYHEELFCEYPEEGLTYIGKSYYKVDYGFHSFTTFDKAYSDYLVKNEYNSCRNDLVIIRCEIPEGSRYWESSDKDEYCSDSIRIVGIVE